MGSRDTESQERFPGRERDRVTGGEHRQGRAWTVERAWCDERSWGEGGAEVNRTGSQAGVGLSS